MAKLTSAELADIEGFNPAMRYNMRRVALGALLLKTPRPAFWWGRTYTITSRHLGAGVYEVTGKFDGPEED
jgi:hypothetical protein